MCEIEIDGKRMHIVSGVGDDDNQEQLARSNQSDLYSSKYKDK